MAIFLKIQGIEGESRHHLHGGEIDLLSWDWEVSTTSGDEKSVIIGAVHLTKDTDKSTPKLLQALINGERIESAVLTFEIVGGGASVSEGWDDDGEEAHVSTPVSREFFSLHMSEVRVDSFAQSCTSDQGPTETLSLRFARGKLRYCPFDITGQPDGDPIVCSWMDRVKE